MVISSGKHVLDREGRKSWGCCQPLAPCCSSFWSCFSSFEMFTRCIIRNWPFKWKTGMSNLYLSYQAEFSGSVMSTSCKINWNRDRLKLYFSATWNNAMVQCNGDKLIPRPVLTLRDFFLLLLFIWGPQSSNDLDFPNLIYFFILLNSPVRYFSVLSVRFSITTQLKWNKLCPQLGSCLRLKKDMFGLEAWERCHSLQLENTSMEMTK